MRPSHSMTGAGFAAGPTELGELRIEVRTVNGRSLSVKVRAPSSCAAYEAALDEAVRVRLRRGTAVVVVERRSSGGAAGSGLLPDGAVLRAVAEELRGLAGELQLPPPSVADVLAAAGTASRGETATSRPLPPQLAELFTAALEDLEVHRRADGAGTVRAIEAQLAEFEQLAANAAQRAPQLAAEYRERLLQRVQEFVAAHVPSPPPAVDLVREVAVWADRTDVAEELQRLAAHVAELRAVLRAGGEIGRRLEFLLQELLRETNTLGAKSPDTVVAHTVVAMKTCIERMKEQAANLE